MANTNSKDKKKKESIDLAAQAGAAKEVVQRYGSAEKGHLVAYSGKDNETGRTLKRGLKKISKSKVSAKVADDGRRELLSERVGWHRSHRHRRRLLLGQQPHRANQPLHLPLQKELPVLRQSRRGGARSHLLLPGLLLPPAPNQLLRIPFRRAQPLRGNAKRRTAGSLPEPPPGPMDRSQGLT